MRDMDNDYTVMPFPKFDENQDKHLSLLATTQMPYIPPPSTVRLPPYLLPHSLPGKKLLKNYGSISGLQSSEINTLTGYPQWSHFGVFPFPGV